MQRFRILSHKRALVAGTAILIAAVSGLSQSDIRRQTVAITYPLDQAVEVKFRGTTRLPRLTGEAKVRRTGRRGTRVELSVKNLPRAYELGSVYTTYVLWAISPEGRADNLGEIKRSGSILVNSKLDVTTPLQTFSLIVTAEPHFLVQSPSRMVVLENLPPLNPGGAEVATINVLYIGNTSDYFNERRVPDLADADYAKTPTSLLGARQALNLARYAGAQNEAPDAFGEAQAQLQQAEDAWRLKQPEEEVDAAARRATSLGAKAEELAGAHRAARERREEISERDRAVREAEQNAASASDRIKQLQASLDKSERARESAEHDLENINQQVRDLRSENARLQEALQAAHAEAENAKVDAARLEGEKSAELKAAHERELAAQFRQNLVKFGKVRDNARGLTLVLPDSLWMGARSAELAPRAVADTVTPLAALLANNTDYKLIIEAYTDSRGDKPALTRLSQDRAQALAQRLSESGIDSSRLEPSGLGPANPVAPNAKPAGRTENRRIEITLILSLAPAAVVTSSSQ